MFFPGASSNHLTRGEGSNLDELDCIHDVLAGRSERFAPLVQTYQAMVYRVCLRFTRNPSAAEDLAQDVFIKAFDSIHSFREDSSFSTWLYQVTLRKCLDWRREQMREWQWRGNVDSAAMQMQDGETPEEQLVNKETRHEVRQWVDQLRDPYRQVVILFYFDHCSYDEISQKTGIPVKTVESQLYRAKRQLRNLGGVRR